MGVIILDAAPVHSEPPPFPATSTTRVPAPACSTALMAASTCAVIRLSARSLHARCVAQSLAAEPTGDRLAAGGGRRRPTDSHVPVTEAACQSFKGDSGVPLTVCPDDAIARGYEGGTDVVIAPEYLPLQARVLRRKCGSRFLKIVQVWLGIEACGRSLTDLRTRRAYLASGAAWRREDYAEEGHAEWGPIHRPSQ